jgi:N6-adenosine-specific RNA methylase IME4
MTNYRNHPITEVFPPLSDSDYQTLKADIAEQGLLEPIWLDKQKRVIDGRHRLRACRELKIEPEYQFTDYEEGDIAGVVVSLNMRRRHLSESQRARIGANLIPFFEKDAKEKIKAGKPAENEDETDPSAKVHSKSKKAEENKSAAKAARVVGVSPRYVAYAKKVEEQGCDELKKAVAADTIPVSDASKIVGETKGVQKKLVKQVLSGGAKNLKQALRAHNQKEAIKQIEAMDPAQGGYPVVVADPAWPYEARKDDTTQRGQTPYPQMTIPQICKVDIPAADDSILFLWTTNSHLVNGNAARVCGAWGYQPKTLITWVKDRMGMGDWARSQTEHIVLAVRGAPKLKEVPSTVFEAARGKHSEKPEEFYQLVERCTAGSKIELFARQHREGWFCHGHAVNQPVAQPEPEGDSEVAAVPQEPVAQPMGPVAPVAEQPEKSEAELKDLQAQVKGKPGRKKNPPKVVVEKTPEAPLPFPPDLAMEQARAAEAAAKVEELA